MAFNDLLGGWCGLSVSRLLPKTISSKVEPNATKLGNAAALVILNPNLWENEGNFNSATFGVEDAHPQKTKKKKENCISLIESNLILPRLDLKPHLDEAVNTWESKHTSTGLPARLFLYLTLYNYRFK